MLTRKDTELRERRRFKFQQRRQQFHSSKCQNINEMWRYDENTGEQMYTRASKTFSHIAWGCGLTPVLLIAHTHASTTFLDAPYIPRCTSRQVNSAIVYIVLGRLGSSTRFRAYRPAEFISLNRRHYQWNYRYSLLSHRIQSWCTVLS